MTYLIVLCLYIFYIGVWCFIYIFFWHVMWVFFMPSLCQKSKKNDKTQKIKKIYMVLILPHPCLFLSLCDLTMGLVFLDGFYNIGWHFYCDIQWDWDMISWLENRGRSHIIISIVVLTVNTIIVTEVLPRHVENWATLLYACHFLVVDLTRSWIP